MKKSLHLSDCINTRLSVIFLVILMVFSINGFSATKTWNNPAAGGAWNVAGNWFPSGVPAANDDIIINPSAAITITAVPSLTIKSLTIGGTGSVNLTGASGTIALQINQTTALTNGLTIGSGATLQLTGTGTSFTLNFVTTANQTGQIDGTLQVNALGIFHTTTVGTTLVTVGSIGTIINNRPTGAAFTTSAATFYFDEGATYNHIANGGVVPTATWNAVSNCNITGITTATTITGISGQTFGYFNWNCAGQTATVSMGIATVTNFNGNFTVVTTNTGTVNFSTGASTINIAGNFLMQAGTAYRINGNAACPMNVEGNLTINSGSFFFANSTTANTLTVNGDFVLTNGTFNMNSAASAVTFNLWGNYNQTGGTFTQTGTTASTVFFRGNEKSYTQSAGTVTNTNINYALNTANSSLTMNNNLAIATGRNFTVTNGTLHIPNGVVISGAGSFIVAAATTATLGIGDANGITTGASGNIQTTTRTFNTAANYILNGTVAQTTGNAFPATVNNLTISNTSSTGLVALTNTCSVSNTLFMNQGILQLGGSNLTIISTSLTAIQGNPTSATNMIAPDGAGFLIKNFPASFTGSYTFPIGDNIGTAEYSPVTINMLVYSGLTGNIQVRLVDGNPPGFTSPYLSRYYTFHTTFVSPYTYSMSFTYPNSDINGNEADIMLSRYNGSVWNSYVSNASSNIITSVSTLNNVTAPLVNTSFYGGNGESTGTYYRTLASGDWNGANTWETANNASFAGATPTATPPTSANSVYIEIRPAHTVILTGSTNIVASDLFVNGTLENQTTGAFTLTASGYININAGGEYKHSRDGGAIPTAFWNATSTCNITGITATNITGGLTQSFGNFTWNPSGTQTATGILLTPGMTIKGSLSVLSGVLNFNGFIVNVGGNIINNGIINTSTAASLLVLNGTSTQTISGSGYWTTVTGSLNNSLLGLTINNTEGVVVNQSFAIQGVLNLTAGAFSTTNSSKITIGNGTVGTLAINVHSNSAILPSAMTLYNLANMTFNLSYLHGDTEYITGGELPSITATSPVAGTMIMGNSGGTLTGNVTLGNSGTVFSTIIYNYGSNTLNLNGNTLRLSGNFTNNSNAFDRGLNAGIADSKLNFIGSVLQTITLGNQTFNATLTTPDIEVSNTFFNNAVACGARVDGTGNIGTLTINSDAYFQINNVNLNIRGNVVNNGVIFTSGTSTTSLITFNGTQQQTVSGNGNWRQIVTNPGNDMFTGIGINNTAGVVLNQNIMLQNTLNLTAGAFSTSNNSKITLGNGINGTILTTVVSSNSAILPSTMTLYNLANVTYHLNYFHGTLEYITGGELPSFSATPPIAGNMLIGNSNGSFIGNVKLGNSGSVFSTIIYNYENNILNLNGYTLRIAGNFTNQTNVADRGLNAGIAGSKLSFIGSVLQTIALGNQTFNAILTTPDVEVSNSFFNNAVASGARIDGIGSIGLLTIHNASYFQINAVNLNVGKNVINNGVIYSNGTSTASTITFNGTEQQTVSGNGNWRQIVTNPGNDMFTGIGINNTAGVVLNQNIMLQNTLNLTAGAFSTSNNSKITLGNGIAATVLTTNVLSNSAILPSSMALYNLGNITYHLNYFHGTTEYITGGELPSFTATPPIAGIMTIGNSVGTLRGNVTLGNSGTVFSTTINNQESNILNLNGHTLRLAGAFTNNANVANRGLNSEVAGSKLSFIGSVYQAITLGNQIFSSVVTAPDIEVSNNFFNNLATSGVGFAATGTVNNIIIHTNSYLHSNFNGIINVRGSIVNNGLYFTAGSNTAAFISFNGTQTQTVSGTGAWRLIGAPAGNGMYIGFQINNHEGVVLNQNVALQNRLDLLTAGGVLSGSGILTLGNGAPSQTLTVNRSFGSLNMTNPVQYNIAGMTYNLNYNSTASATPITTGGELPPDTYAFYKAGTLTINNTAANGGVVMGRNSSIANLNMPTGTLFDLDAYTIRVYGTTYTLTGTALINASNATAKISFIGVAAQTLGGTMAANYVDNYISNIEVNNNAGVVLPITQIGSSSINGSLTMTLGTVTLANSNIALTIFGTVSSNPQSTLTSGGTSTGLLLRGPSGNMGTIYLTNYLTGATAQTIGTLDVNITGTNPQVAIMGNLAINTTFILTNGVVNMGPYAVNYANPSVAAGTSMLPATQSSWNGYFAFNGTSSGLNWTMNSVAAGTYRWLIGPSVATGFRPITLTTSGVAGNATSLKIGYHGNIAGTAYSQTDIVSAENKRSNYIATLNFSSNAATVGNTTVVMEYQDSDFNTAPTDEASVNIWYYDMPPGSGTSIWTSTAPQTSNGTNGINTTISKTAAINLNSGKVIPLNLAETNNDAGISTNTFIWTGTGGAPWTTITAWSPNVTLGNAPGEGTNIGCNVIIPQVANQPTATNLTLSLNDITIGTGTVLTMATGGSLTISGNFYNNNFNGTNYGYTCAAGHTTTYTGTGKLIAPGLYGNLTFSGATNPILSPVGTIAIAGTFTPVNSGVTYTGSTILFNGATQTAANILAFDFFNNVIFGNLGTAHTLGGDITVYGDMIINTTTFNDGGRQITGPGLASGKTMTILPKGTARTYTSTHTGAKAFPEFQYYDIYGTDATYNIFNFNGANIATQTIPGATYGTVNMANGTINKKQLGGDATFRGLFTLNSGSFDDGGYTLTLIRGLTNNAATPAQGSISSTGNGKILLTGGIAVHPIATATTANTTYAFGNIELADAFGATITNAATTTGTTNINGNIKVTSGTFSVNLHRTAINFNGNIETASPATIIFSNGTGTRNVFGNVINNGIWSETAVTTYTFHGDIENNGLLNASTGAHAFSGTNKEIRGTSFISIPSVTMNGTYTNKLTGTYTLQNGGPTWLEEGGFRVLTTFAGSGTLTQDENALLIIQAAAMAPNLVASASGNTVVFRSASASTIKSPSGTNYHNLILTPTGGVAFTLGGNVKIDNNLTFAPTVAGATLNDAATFKWTGSGSSVGTFTMNSPFASTMNLVNTSLEPFPTFETYNIGLFNTVSFNAGVAQNIVNSDVTDITFGNLTISGANLKTAQQNITVLGNLAIGGGGIADNGYAITVNRNISGAGNHISTGTGAIVLSGGSMIHTISKTNNFGNLTLNNPHGAIVTAAFNVTGELALQEGIFQLGAVVTTLSGTISYPTPGGFLAGNLSTGSTSTLTIAGITGGSLGTIKFAPEYNNIGTLTMSRTGGTYPNNGSLILGTDLTINTALTLSANGGYINLANNDLILGPIATASAGSSNVMVIADAASGTGQMKKIFGGTATNFTFPIGDNSGGSAEYSPVILTGFTSIGGFRTIGVSITDNTHPEMDNLPEQSNYITRFVTISDDGGSSGYTYTNLSIPYYNNAFDVVGTVNTANVQMNRHDGTEWTQLNSTVTPNGTAPNLSTITLNTGFTYGNTFYPLVSGTVPGSNDYTARMNSSVGQTYEWLPTASGNYDWNIATNWASVPGGQPRYSPNNADVLLFSKGGTTTAINVPTQTIAQMFVSENTNISLQAASGVASVLTINNIAGTNFSIEAGSTLQISTETMGTVTLTFAGVTGQISNIAGNLIVNKNGAFTTVVNNPVQFAAGSFYIHNRDGGALPAANVTTWNPASTCRITGVVTTNPTGLTTSTFGNFIWDSPGMGTQTAATIINIAGDFSILQGTYFVSTGTLNVAGDFTNNGTFTSANAGGTIVMNGTSNTQTLSGNGLWMGIVAGCLYNLTINNTSGNDPAVIINSSFAVQNQLYMQSGIIGGTGVLTEGIGTGTFTLIRHAGSMKSDFSTTFNLTNVTFNALYGNALAPIIITTGNEFPYSSVINNLTCNFNAVGGRVILGGNVSLGATGVLSLTNTVLHINDYDLTLNNIATGAITGTFGINNMIAADGAGQFRRTIGTTNNVSYNFPIGDLNGTGGTTHYSPALFVFATNSLTRIIGIRVTNAPHLENEINGEQTDYVNRYWTLTDSEFGNGTYTFAATASQFQFTFSTSDVSDVNGIPTNYKINRWNASQNNWVQLNSTVAAPAVHTNTVNNQTSSPLHGEYTLRNNPYTEYTWVHETGEGDWQDADSWSPPRYAPFASDVLKFDNGGTSVAVNIPSQSIGQISVTNSTNISFKANATSTLSLGHVASPANVLNIDGTSTLQLSSEGAIVHTLAFLNTATYSTTIAGTLIVNANNTFNNAIVFTNLLAANNTITGTVINNGGIITATAATTRFGANSIYRHNRNGGIIPVALWDINSLCNIIGVVSTPPTGFTGQTFGKFTWNCEGQETNISMGLSSATIFAGDFTLVSTGTPSSNQLGLYSSSTTTSTFGTSSVPADLIVQDGTLVFNTGTTAPGLILYGNYNQTGGTVIGGTSTGVLTFSFTNTANRTYTQSATATTSGMNLVTFSVPSGSSLTLNNDFLNVGTARTFTIGGTLFCGTNILGGSGNFTLSANATLGIGSPDGITTTGFGEVGNIQVSGTRTYTAGANYIFESTATATGNAFGSTNPLTAVFNGANIDLTVPATITGTTGALQLNNSLLKLGNNNLTLNQAAATITGATPSNSNMIVINGTGQLFKQFPASATSPFTFPIGDITGTADYSPVTLTFTSNSTARTLGIRVTDERHPNDIPTNPDYLTRYWSMTSSSTAAATVNLDFTYISGASDVTGTESNLKINSYNPPTSIWTEHSTTLDSPVLSITGNTTLMTGSTIFDVTGRNNVSTIYYRSKQSGNWNDIATWEVTTDPAYTSPAPQPATIIPTNANSDGILIQNGHTVTVFANATADDLTVESGGQLNINPGIILTLANGPAVPDMTVNGTLYNQGTLTTTGTLIIGTTGTYEHALNGGTIPTATWTSGSTCTVTGIVGTAPTGLAQAFSNFIWNCPSQTVNVNMAYPVGPTTITGDFSVITTNTAYLALSNIASTINISGNLNLNGGTFYQSIANVVNTLNITGNLNIDNATFIRTSGTSAQTMTINGNLNVAEAGVLVFSASSNGGTVNVRGNIVNNGTVNGSIASSNLVMNGTASQTISGTGVWTENLTRLTINNATGVSLLIPFGVTNLTLTNGVLNTSSTNLLTIKGTTAGSITGGSATTYVNGPLAREFASGLSGSSGTWTFPIGKANYNLFELLHPNTNATGTVTIEVFDEDAGGAPGSGVVELNTNRYWSAQPSSAFITSTNVRITEGTLGSANRITQNATATLGGIYNSVGGNAPSPLTSSLAVASTLGYFVLGNAGMTYTSSTTNHPLTTIVAPNTSNQQILRIQIVTAAGTPALKLNALTLNTNGTTNDDDILNARVYYTGTTNTFSTATQFGNTVTNPSGVYQISDTPLDLLTGTNYFWLTYDIPATAILGNIIDAECTEIILNAGSYSPSPTAPSGNRRINYIYCTPGTNSDGPCGDLGYPNYSISTVTITASGNNYFNYTGGTCMYGTYNNLSGNNYDGPFAPLVPGSTYTFSVTKNGGSTQRVRIWIDWNNDGILSSSEMIMNSTATSPTVTVTVPPTSPGGWHRMRTAMGNSFTDVNDACNAGTYSMTTAIEYRDFTVKFAAPCDFPTVQASMFGSNTTNTTSTNITFDRGNGNGGVIVLARAGSAVNSNPTSGNTYTANASFGLGDQIGTGNYVVYHETGSGSGTVTVPVSGLTPGVTYHFAVYEYNETATCYNLTQLTGNVPIPLCMPPIVQASGSYAENAIPGSVDIIWTDNGDGDGGVIVFVRATNPIVTHPSQTVNYNANSVWPTGDQIGATGARAVYKGSGGTVTVTDLPVNTTYHYAIYSYNSSTNCYMSPPETGSFFIPYCFPPTTQLSAVQTSNITHESAQLSWTAGGGDASFVLLKQGSAVNASPVLTTGYTANSAFGNGEQLGSGNFVVHSSTPNTVSITNLIPNTTYYYAAYTYFEAEFCYMLSGATGSFTTADGPMTYISSTNVQQTGNSPLGSTNQPILRLAVVTGTGTAPALNMSSITFNTTGTTNVADLTGARIFYTGNSTTFNTATPFGGNITNPSGSHTISGSQTLIPGTNYFWLVYDVSIGATVGNVMDAQITSVDVGSQQTPDITNPAGHRTITSLMSLSCGYTYSNVAATWVSNVGQSGTSVIASGAASIDDQRWPNQNFAEDFTFEFNGNVYNSFGIHSKGFIWFGSTTPPGMFWSPISSSSGYEGAIAAWAFDMIAHSSSSTTPQVTVRYTGTAPNRVCIIEWTAFRPYANTGGLCGTFGYSTDWNRYDIQLRLNENGGALSNQIDIVVRDQNPYCINGNGASAQVGLRGASNTDFLNRTGGSGNTVHQTNSIGTANTQTLNHGSNNYFNSTRILRFTPTFEKPIVSPSISASNTCPETTVELNTTSTVTNKQWYNNNLPILGANTSTYAADTDGTYIIVVSQGGCSKVSDPVVVSIIPCIECADVVSPLHASVNNELTTVLEWTALQDAELYNVYFGTTNSPPYVATTTSLTYIPFVEHYNTTYYWRINSVVDGVETGDCYVRSFKTKVLSCPIIEAPLNEAQNVELAQLLYWEALPGNVSYDVYFGLTTPPPFLENVFTNTYNPGTLVMGETYYWKIVPKTANSSVADCDIVNFTTFIETSTLDLTWTGNMSSEWNNANNWNPNFVPTSTNNVLIPGTYTNPPVVNASKTEPARAKNLTISSPATLTIDPNKALTVHGDLENNGTLHIRSAQNPQMSIHFTHDGSLIVLGNRNGSGSYKVDRYFSGSFWHMVSSPITSAQAVVFANLWVREYNEPTNTWGAFVTSLSTPLTTGKGFSVWSYNTSETRSFNGLINHGTIPISVQYTNNPNLGPHQKGWNLVGNPYPSAINWNQASGWTKTNIANTIYLYSAGTGNYMTWNGMFGLAGPMIAMGQGFFVQTSAANPVLTVNSNAQIHHDVSFRNEEASLIQINVVGNNYADHLLIAVRPDASADFDFTYDAVKLPGIEEAPQLHTMKQDARLAVNTVQSEDDIVGMFVHLQVGAPAEYTLTYTHSLISDDILLRDKVTSQIIHAGQTYRFIGTPSDKTDRFEFVNESNVMNTQYQDMQSVIPVWEHNNMLYVGNLEDQTLTTISIYNILGAKVMSSASHITDLNTLPTGVYNVKVFTDKQIRNKKIIVK